MVELAAEGRPGWRVAVGAVARHPLATVAVLGTVLALAQLWWFTDVRALGAFNTDEAGYLANGLRIQRQIGPDLKPLLDRVVERHPEVAVGSYPRWRSPDYKTKVTFDACAEAPLQAAVAEFLELLPEGEPQRVE